ncbi:hypothetical protein [Telluribacter sp.]|jgi:uncharacterized protein (TIGR02588 family)|uniref:hypothetical protein n=1 Tax=Telluribacter sp. TaxID=1978767 RepID=UPI002E128AE6|nr:hypothetical protein [Telluribacter sp.]
MESGNSTYVDKKNALEWVVAVTGLVLVLIIIGYLTYKTITVSEGPPQLFLEYFHEPGHYEPNRYHIIVHNKGAETAESIIVEMALEKGGEALEVAQLDVAFCPKESYREGWVSFLTNPSEADTIKARVVSYNKP